MITKLRDVAFKVIYGITARIRPVWLLRLLPRLPGDRLFFMLFNPNVARRYTKLANKKEIYIKNELGQYYADVNDSIGYKLLWGDREIKIATLGIAMGLSEKDYYLDVGANIGTTCIPVANRTGCKIIAVEASKDTGSYLLKNLFLNRVVCIPLVLAATNQTKIENRQWVNLLHVNGNTGSNQVRTETNASETSEICFAVNLSSVFSLVQELNIRLAKFDVEGHEALAISGCGSVLASVPIIFEYIARDQRSKENAITLSHDRVLYHFTENLDFFPFNENNNDGTVIAIPFDIEKSFFDDIGVTPSLESGIHK